MTSFSTHTAVETPFSILKWTNKQKDPCNTYPPISLYIQRTTMASGYATKRLT